MFQRYNYVLLKSVLGTSLVVQWLRFLTSNPKGEGPMPGQGAKILHDSWPKKPKHKIEAIL